MMNKKGTIGDIVQDNVIYLILLIIFIAGMFVFIYSKTNGASIWGDYYAKEVAGVIDLAKPGDIIILDVQKATEVAKGNKISDFEQIFNFDNMKSEVCVKLSSETSSCYNFFNNVNVAIVHNNKWIHFAEPINRLHFQIIAKAGTP